MIRLRPCPFCGSEDTDIEYVVGKTRGFAVQCAECGASGGIAYSDRLQGYDACLARMKSTDMWNVVNPRMCYMKAVYLYDDD